ncbi:MAG: helix-turn-helix domain-containing protein [Pseudomonadota bacterium]
MILGVLYFAAFTHAVIIASALIRRTSIGAPSTILAALLGVFGYALFNRSSLLLGFFREIPHALALIPMIAVYIGPLTYGYVKRSTGAPPWSAIIWLLHLLPAAGFWISNAPFVFQPAADKIAYWEVAGQGQLTPLPFATIATFLLVKAHLTTYLVLSWRRLKGYHLRLADLRADDSQSVLAQLSVLILSLAALEAVWVVLFAMQQFFGIGALDHVNRAWLLFMAAIVLSFGYLGLRQSSFLITPEERALDTLLRQKRASIQTESKTDTDTIKYLHSALPDSAADEIAALIEETLSEKHLYLNEKLTLQQLAEAIDAKPHLLSQVINQRMQTNFYRLINGYRVSHASGLLDDPNLTWPIERIAVESGFSNRVTFNKAFKDHLGCTASHYRKGVRKKAQAS